MSKEINSNNSIGKSVQEGLSTHKSVESSLVKGAEKRIDTPIKFRVEKGFSVKSKEDTSIKQKEHLQQDVKSDSREIKKQPLALAREAERGTTVFKVLRGRKNNEIMHDALKGSAKDVAYSLNKEGQSVEAQASNKFETTTTLASVEALDVASRPYRKGTQYLEASEKTKSAIKDRELAKKEFKPKVNASKNNFKQKQQREVFKNKVNLKNANNKLDVNVELLRNAKAKAANRTELAVEIGKTVFNLFSKAISAIGSRLKQIKLGTVFVASILVISVILLGSIGIIASSPYGIIYSDDNSSDYTLQEAMQLINSNFEQELINKEKEYETYSSQTVLGDGHIGSTRIEGTESIITIDNQGCGYSIANWSDMVAVWDVKINMLEEDDVFDITQSKFEKLQSVVRDMYSFSIRKTQKEKEVTYTTKDWYMDESKALPILVYGDVEKTETFLIDYIIIEVNYKSIDDMVNKYNFDNEQEEMVYELVSDSDFIDLFFDAGFTANIDFNSLSFDNENVNDVQKSVVAVALNASKYGITAQKGMCQGWVADVCAKATNKSRASAHCALCAGNRWSVSKNWADIQVGATVYGYASPNNPYGHVGIYIGNGKVIHNLMGCVKIDSLETWVTKYGSKNACWGWNGGYNLTGDTKYKTVGGLIAPPNH